MKNIVIFGTGLIAELAYHYFLTDSSRTVSAFTVERDYLANAAFKGRPVVDFARIEHEYPPENFGMFVAIGYRSVNRERARVYETILGKGYTLVSHISPRACVETGTEIGNNCLVMPHAVVMPGARIHFNTIIWASVHIGTNCTVREHSYISCQSVLGGNCTIGPFSFLGLNCTIRDGVKEGQSSVIGAGALILRDTPAHSVFRGKLSEPLSIESHKLSRI